MILYIPDLHDFLLPQPQNLVFEGDELYIFVAVSLCEFDRLVEIFPFFDEFESEEVASRFDFLKVDLCFRLLGSG